MNRLFGFATVLLLAVLAPIGAAADGLVGPGFLLEGDVAALAVICGSPVEDSEFDWSDDRTRARLKSPDEDRPKHLQVTLDWSGRNLALSSDAVEFKQGQLLSSVSLRIDDGPEESESWQWNNKKSYSWVEKDDAARFLRRLLPPAAQLTVYKDFARGERLSETFALSGVADRLAQMEPECPAVGPLAHPPENRPVKAEP